MSKQIRCESLLSPPVPSRNEIGPEVDDLVKEAYYDAPSPIREVFFGSKRIEGMARQSPELGDPLIDPKNESTSPGTVGPLGHKRYVKQSLKAWKPVGPEAGVVSPGVRLRLAGSQRASSSRG
ncbi:hypothetical protein J7T55_007775 [Diaporthe amygdali]|uniref:uncharacterized protein n=1 Tax=Phomopsis amygdali TaxID=1214568 RepID=UPI0022FE9AA9|nr:uncharacterized protein J7T55_007775 [Diaporthe amygdali]KAJ0107585.1 hypothetical protein J7T55_007775 [Diaporthe amygdali]